MAERLEGKIITLKENGFGFIQYKDGNIFFHYTALEFAHIAFKDLNVDDLVSFCIGNGKKPGSIAARDIRLERRSESSQQPEPTTKLPYVHVPIQENKSLLGEPVPHNSTDNSLISGSLSLELEVLTPLLMANYQLPYDQLPQYYQDLLPEDFKELMSSEQNKSTRQKKKFLIPNYVEITTGINADQTKERRLVLPGKSIKNVLRRSLIALCQAPFERVAERYYTRAPNLQVNGKNTRNQAAYITAIEGDTLKVKLINKVYFLDKGATKLFEDNKLSIGEELNNPKGYRLKEDNYKPKIFSGTQLLGQWIPALYKGGSDGIGELATVFENAKAQKNSNVQSTYKTFLHSVVFFKAEDLKARLIDISSDVYHSYREAQDLLAERIDEHPFRAQLGDTKAKKIKEKIKALKTLQVGQLIYVELDNDSNQIIRIGRHYYYKTRTKHSLKQVNNQHRKEFEPNSAETNVKEHTQIPKLLTAARLLMGYVRDEDTQHIVEGPWQHYKGRIAVVDAVSQDTIEQGTNTLSSLQLNVALGPKGSAVRLLDQSNGLASFEHENTTLNGYPFYRHVCAASVNAQLKTLQQPEFYKNDLGPIGFDVCHTGTFKTTVTFANLHDWELGALLCLLEPHHLLTSSQSLSEGKQFAHKLGYGKSIGMGSVALKVNTIEHLVDITTQVNGKCRKIPKLIKLNQTQYVEAFKVKLAEAKIDYQPWLAVHLFDPNNTAELRYPAIKCYQEWNKALATEQRGKTLQGESSITSPFIAKANKLEL